MLPNYFQPHLRETTPHHLTNCHLSIHSLLPIILSRTMKVIVTGATGNAGGGIVKACLADDRITTVLILTRRNVAGDIESHPKVQVVMHRDFSAYPDELMQHLEGAEACIW